MKEQNSYYEVLNKKAIKQINELETLYKNAIEKIQEQQIEIEKLKEEKDK